MVAFAWVAVEWELKIRKVTHARFSLAETSLTLIFVPKHPNCHYPTNLSFDARQALRVRPRRPEFVRGPKTHQAAVIRDRAYKTT